MTGSTEGAGGGTAGGSVTAPGRRGVERCRPQVPHVLRHGSIGLMIQSVLPVPLLRIRRVMKTRITLIQVV